MQFFNDTISNIGDTVSNIGDRASDGLTNVINRSSDTLTTDTGSVNVSIIISIVLILMIIYIAMYYHRQSAYSPYLLLDVTSTGGNNAVIVQPNKIPDSKNSDQYSYSFWIYISSDALVNHPTSNDKKIIFSREGDSAGAKSVYAIDVKKKTLLIRHALNGNTEDLLLDSNDNIVKCDFENFPYDRFIHVAVVKYGYTLVLYINGILVKSKTTTKKFMNLYSSDSLNNYYKDYTVVPGWYSKIRYFVDFNRGTGGALNDKQVYDIYLNSPYPSLLEKLINSIFGKIISFNDEDNVESKYDKYKSQLTKPFPHFGKGSGNMEDNLRQLYQQQVKVVSDADKMRDKLNELCKSKGANCNVSAGSN